MNSNNNVIRLSESTLRNMIREAIKDVLYESPRKSKEWQDDEFVDYEEYAAYGVPSDQWERNYNRSIKLGIPQEQRCPFCEKPLKDGSYKTMYHRDGPNGVKQYYRSSALGGTPINVGNGCFKRLQQAYDDKYNKK